MTSIAVQRTEHFSENRSWIHGTHGLDMTPSITLDPELFTAATHYPKSFVRSGISLGKVTATRLYGPYDPDATDGRENFAGHLFGTLRVVGPNGQRLKKVGGALFVHGAVTEASLPPHHGLDAAAKAAQSLILYI